MNRFSVCIKPGYLKLNPVFNLFGYPYNTLYLKFWILSIVLDKIYNQKGTRLTIREKSGIIYNILYKLNLKAGINIKINIKKLVKSLKTKEGRRELVKNYKEFILYFVFGIGTTIISMVSYYLIRVIFPNAESVPPWLSWIFNITSVFNIESNTALPVIISWFLSVTFAFLTNRVYVFDSRVKTFGGFMLEAMRFYASRIATLFVDLLIMFLLVDLTGIHNVLYEFMAKVFSNVFVLIINYILSKVFVFRKRKPEDDIDNSKQSTDVNE